MIAYFVYNLNFYSGASQQALLLAKTLNQPLVIFNHEKNRKVCSQKIGESIRVVNLPNNKVFSLFTLIYYMFVLRVSLVHLHGFFKHGILLGKLFRAKIILKTTLMNSDDFETLCANARYRSMFRYLVSKIDINICLTDQLKEKNERYINSKKIRVIPNGVELPIYTQEKKENIFCFVGLVCERKGAYESIKYFLKNYISLPDSKMYVIGPTNGLCESDKDYIERCLDLIKSHNAQDRVVLTGNLLKQEVQMHLNLSKALLFFSRNEGMPNVVLEAMAYNCLPITTGLDGVMERILGSYLSDYLVLDNFDSVVDVSLIDEILAKRTVANRVSEEYSITSISFLYSRLYEELLV